MTRGSIGHCRVVGLLLALLVLTAVLPGEAAYTKLYKCKNITGIDQSHFRVINNALEVITGYTCTPSEWSPPVIGTCTWNGVYCTKLRFGDIGLPWVAPNEYGYVGWTTADNNCRLSDLRWVAPSGATYVITNAVQQQGVPGGGEVQYVDGEYVWLLINDTDAPIDLSDVSLQVFDEAPSLEDLQGMIAPQALMWTLAAQEEPPHPDIVAERVDAVIADIAPLWQAVADAEDGGYITAADEKTLQGHLDYAVAGLEDGEESYPFDPEQAEEDWGQAIVAMTDFSNLVAEIDAEQPTLYRPASWPHWAAITYGKVNDTGVVTGYCKPTGSTHYALLWDSREPGDDGFVDLHGIALNDLELPSYYLTTARDINSDGCVVGAAFASYGGAAIGVLWEPDEEGGYAATGVSPPGGYYDCEFYGINDLGQIVAWARDHYGVLKTLLYQLTDGGVGYVQNLGLVDCAPTDINNVGQIGGMYWSGSVYKPFRWDPPEIAGGEPRLIVEQTGGYWSHARVQEISDEGLMVGDDYVKGWLWLDDEYATPVPLSTYPPSGKTYGVNAVGDAVGYYSSEAAAWDLTTEGNPMRSLHATVWQGSSQAHDVNEVGTVAGWCQPESGGAAYAFVGGLDVLPYVLPEGLAADWLAAADDLMAAIDWLPGPGEALAEELPPPATPPPPPPPPGGDPADEYEYVDWGEMQGGETPTLPADSYTAFTVPDDDGAPDETLVLTTNYYETPATPAMMRTMQAGEPYLQCVEMYTPGEEGVLGSDTTIPVIESASVSPVELWPANHKMVGMHFEVEVSDEDDAGDERPASWFVESVSSDQEEDGKFEPDWMIDPDDQQSLQLRAERDPRDRDGRIYTIVLRAADSAGNLSEPETLQVLVPHDQGRHRGGKITSLAALQAGAGAEIVFTLASEAQVEVEVLNIAGRRVRTIVSDRDCEAGVTSLAWNCRSDRGVMVPSGAYLVRVTARSEDGEQSSRLCTMMLRR